MKQDPRREDLVSLSATAMDYRNYRAALTHRLQNDWEIGDALLKDKAQSEGDLVVCENIAKEMDVELSVESLRRLRNIASAVKTAADRRLLSARLWGEAIQAFPGHSLEGVREEIKRMQKEGRLTRRELREEKAKRSQDILGQWAEMFVDNPEGAIEWLNEADEETRTWVFKAFPEVKGYIDSLNSLTVVIEAGDVEKARERTQNKQAEDSLASFRKDPAAYALDLMSKPASHRNRMLATLLSAVPEEEEGDLREEITAAFREATVIDKDALSRLAIKVAEHLTPQRVAAKLVALLIEALEPIDEANRFVSDNEEAVHALNETQREAILDALRSFAESNGELQARLEVGGIQYVSDITGGKP